MDALGRLIKKAIDYLYSRVIISEGKLICTKVKSLHDGKKGE